MYQTSRWDTMVVRTGSKHMYEKERSSSNHESSSSLVTSLMKSWKISSSPSSSKRTSSLPSSPSTPVLSSSPTTNTAASAKAYGSRTSSDSLSNMGFYKVADGNIEAYSKKQISSRRTSSSYSPLRYVNPLAMSSSSVLESPRANSGLGLHKYNSHGNGGSTSRRASGHDVKKPAKYFRDLDEDWSAVIDDYNSPIPTMVNGGYGAKISRKASESNTLSRVSTSSSVATNTTTKVGSNSLSYPQLPQLKRSETDHLRTQKELEDTKEVQHLNAIIKRIAKFDSILKDKSIINLQELRQVSWNGIPKCHRPVVWKLLIGYLPANIKRQENLLNNKRKEYKDSLAHTFSDKHARDEPTWHQIEIDIPRTNPHIPLYQFKTVQQSLQRILYLWAIRHPASGYVQGINDLATPFYQTFLTEYLSPSKIEDVESTDPLDYMTPEQIEDVEADTFWCLTKLLEQITDNYIQGQPGILNQVKNLSQLVKRIDGDLYSHFQDEHVEFIQFSFRWMNCLLMREFQMSAVIRMWDTYLAETSSESSATYSHKAEYGPPRTPTEPRVSTFTTPVKEFNSPSASMKSAESTKLSQSSLNEFHVFVCAAFLVKWSDQLLAMDFQEIITFLQNPPTKDWDENEIEMLLSEAYIWQSLYKDATSHWL